MQSGTFGQVQIARKLKIRPEDVMIIKRQLVLRLKEQAAGEEVAAKEARAAQKRMEHAQVEERGGKERNESQEAKKALEDYRTHLRKGLPVRERAERLIELARSDDPRVSAAALSKVDEIDGISARVEDDAKIPMPGPMFILPEGDGPGIDFMGPSEELDKLATRKIDLKELLPEFRAAGEAQAAIEASAAVTPDAGSAPPGKAPEPTPSPASADPSPGGKVVAQGASARRVRNRFDPRN